MTQIGKWLWMTNIMLLLKIRYGSWCPVRLVLILFGLCGFLLIKSNLMVILRGIKPVLGDGKTQQVGIDCGETFSPVVRPVIIRTVLSLSLSKAWPIHQLDCKNVFLHGDL